MPKPEAPVVWGMQKLKIREDYIFLEQEFFDEDLQPVKILTTEKIGMMRNKLFPRVWKMRKHAVEDEYTIMEYSELAFNIDVPGNFFSVSSLKTPGRYEKSCPLI